MTIENFFINGNEDVKDVINRIIKKIGSDKMNDIFNIAIKKWDGSDQQWSKLAESIGRDGLLFNPNYTQLAAPLVPSKDGYTPFIAIKSNLASQAYPALLSSLSYSIFYIYYHSIMKKSKILHDYETVLMSISFFSEYQSVRMILEWISEKHLPVTAKELRDSAVEELFAINDLPEKTAQDSIPQFAMSYLAKLRVMRELKIVPDNETWPKAENYFKPQFGANWDIIKGIFLEYYKDFFDVIKQACEE